MTYSRRKDISKIIAMNRRGVFLVVFVLLIALGVWIFLSQNRSTSTKLPSEDLSSSRREKGHLNRSSQSPATVSRLRIGSLDAKEAKTYTLEVCDQEGRPVSGAVLQAEPDVLGLKRNASCVPLAKTNESGLITLSWPLRIGEAGAVELVIRHRDFLATPVPFPSEPCVNRILLQRGAVVRFTFQDSTGLPVSDAGVRLSREIWNDRRLPEAIYDSLPDATAGALHWSRSNSEGVAEVRSLGDGDYYVSFDIPWATVTSQDLRDGVLSLGGGSESEVLCRVRPIHAAVFRVKGDRIFQARFSSTVSGERGIGADRLLYEARKKLQHKFPSAMIYVEEEVFALPLEGRVKCRAQLYRSGWQEFQVPLRPISEIHEAFVLDLCSYPSCPISLAHLQIDVVDSRGRFLDDVRILLRGEIRGNRSAFLSSGERKEILADTYTHAVILNQPWIRDRLHSVSIKLGEGMDEKVRFKVMEPACKLRLGVVRSDGLPAGSTIVSLGCACGYRCQVRVSSEKATLWLPAGRVSGSATSFGCPQREFEVLLKIRDEVKEYEITLD